MPSMPPKHHRHPLCPECNYDLVATIGDNKRRCPECGYEFLMSELGREVRDGDWTVWRGIGKTAKILAMRAVLIAIGWAVTLVAVNLADSQIVPGSAWVAMLIGAVNFFVVMAAGLIIGNIISRDLYETAGIDGLAVTFLAMAFAFVPILIGVMACQLVTPITVGNAVFLVLIPWAFAAIVITKKTVLADY